MAGDTFGEIEGGIDTSGDTGGDGGGRLRRLLKQGAGGNEGGSNDAPREIGSGAGFADAGTADLVAISEKRKRGRKPLTEAERAARAAERATARATSPGKSGEKIPEKAVKPPAPDPVEIPTTLVDQVAGALGGIHQMLALAMRAPEFALSKTEAEALTKSTLNVARWYVPLDAKPGKWSDITALGVTAFMIYAPRIGAMRKRQTAPAPAQPEEQRPN